MAVSARHGCIDAGTVKNKNGFGHKFWNVFSAKTQLNDAFALNSLILKARSKCKSVLLDVIWERTVRPKVPWWSFFDKKLRSLSRKYHSRRSKAMVPVFDSRSENLRTVSSKKKGNTYSTSSGRKPLTERNWWEDQKKRHLFTYPFIYLLFICFSTLHIVGSLLFKLPSMI